MSLHPENLRRMFIGLDEEVPLLDGTRRPYVNLDNAATTPPFRQVAESVNCFLKWYSSVHRGTGYKSRLSTELYNRCRETVSRFAGADPSYHTTFFCYNTTDAINRLCRHIRLKDDEIILTTVMEHHSNMLPWRLCGGVEHVGINLPDGTLDLNDLERRLQKRKGKIRLVAVTGASNLTGCVPPIRKIARAAHEHGALILVDCAQLVAHSPLNMGAADDPEHLDFAAFSAHKMYAPFGSGALIGPKSFFEDGPPGVWGGGAVDLVSLNEIAWSQAPEKEEAGTPNLIGILAMAKAAEILMDLGMDNVERHEKQLTAAAMNKLKNIEGIILYGKPAPSPGCDRVSVIPILPEKMNHALLAAALGYEWGIGVRNGCFCAHPYIEHLFQLTDQEIGLYMKQIRAGDHSALPGFVRISLGLYNTEQDLDYLSRALGEIMTNGPRYRYRQRKETGEYLPENTPDSFDLELTF